MPIEWGSVAEWVSGVASSGAVIVALYLSTSSDRKAASKERQSDQAIAHNTTLKIALVLNGIADLKRHFGPAFENTSTDNPFDARWPYVQGVNGLMPAGSIRLGADEIDFLFRLGNMKLAQELRLALRQHEATIAAADTYRDLREAMLAKAPSPVAARSELGTVEQTAKEIIALKPQSAVIERTLEGLIDRLASEWEYTLGGAGEFGKLVRTRFRDPHFPLLRPTGLSKSLDGSGE